MSYRLVWKRIAIQHLANVWLNAHERKLVTLTNDYLERLISQTPLTIGESRTSSVHRVVIHAPLAIEYIVVEDDKKVFIRAAWSV